MVTRVLRLVLIISLLLPLYSAHMAIAQSDLPYKIYLPIVANGKAPTKTYLPVIENAFTPLACRVVVQSPADGSYILANDEFDVSWAIQNTGENTWRAASTVIAFTGGDRMQTGSDVRDMPYDVSPGAQLNVSIHMKAPSTAGRYVANWALKESSATLCQFYIRINVL